MATIKTYILAPNFSYHPNTLINLGSIIQDPTDPTDSLHDIPSDDLPPTVSHIDYDATFSSSTTRSFNTSIWAKFLEVASAGVGGSNSKTVFSTYSMSRLETVYFKTQINKATISKIVNEHAGIRTAMKSGALARSKPVYLVSGLKIARGFRVRSGNGRSVGAQVSAEVSEPLTGGVGVGVEVGRDKTWEDVQEFSSSGGGGGGEDDDDDDPGRGDIVFAYQLHAITKKRQSNNKNREGGAEAEVKVRKGKGAFLSDSDDDGRGRSGEEGEEDDVEIGEAGTESFEEYDDEMEIEKVELGVEDVGEDGEGEVEVVVLA